MELSSNLSQGDHGAFGSAEDGGRSPDAGATAEQRCGDAHLFVSMELLSAGWAVIRAMLVRRGLYGLALVILALWLHDVGALVGHLR